MSDDTAIGPGEMLDAYKDIRISVDGEQVILQVDAYRNASRGAASNGGCAGAIKVKDALKQVAPDVWASAGGSISYMDVFTGKGSPEAIAAVMQAFYDYSGRFIRMFPKDKSTPVGRCALWLADDNLSWQESLQNISHEFIGLDCNGFVGNWLKKCDHSLKLKQNSVPQDVYNARKITRRTVSEVEYWDVVVWVNFSHIAAILGEGAGGSPRFYICQSAGGGPRCNLYEITAVSPGVFPATGWNPSEGCRRKRLYHLALECLMKAAEARGSRCGAKDRFGMAEFCGSLEVVDRLGG